MFCPFQAINAASGSGLELGIALVERCLSEQQKDVVFYPLLEMPNRKNDALGLPCGSSPILAKAACEGGFLLGCLELRQKQGVSYTDLLGIERLHDCRNKFRQSGAAGDVRGELAYLRTDLLDGVFRLLQIQKRMKALRLLKRVSIRGVAGSRSKRPPSLRHYTITLLLQDPYKRGRQFRASGIRKGLLYVTAEEAGTKGNRNGTSGSQTAAPSWT